MAGRRVGIFGGTFDPVHVGHLIVAEEARVRLGLERVVFVPARISPHKLDDEPAPRSTAMRMVCEAVADNPLFAVSAIEIEREGPSFTVDTLLHLRRGWRPTRTCTLSWVWTRWRAFPAGEIRSASCSYVGSSS